MSIKISSDPSRERFSLNFFKSLTAKNGISIDKVTQFVKYCINDLNLNVIGLMCIPPVEGDPTQYFKNLAEFAKINNLNELSMGMSNDYECAIKNGATFIRIGSKIFADD